MKKIGKVDALRYWFDNLMSKGALVLIAWLGFATILLILFSSAVLITIGVNSSFGEALWISLIHALDTGALGADISWKSRFILIVMSLAGLMLLSVLIGIVTNGIEEKLQNLRKGRSIVAEKEHTVILGWSSQIYLVISELVSANQNRKRHCIVILAEKDKIEMEDDIFQKSKLNSSTKIVCRSGNPGNAADLRIARIDQCKSVIILPPDSDDSDLFVVKTILAINKNQDFLQGNYHIVSQVKKNRNSNIICSVGSGNTEIVPVDDLVSRIILQTSMQSGLSKVHMDLLDYEGDEIYIQKILNRTLIGISFGDALFRFDKSMLIGLVKSGDVILNPPMNTIIEKDDQIIVISENNEISENYEIKNPEFFESDIVISKNFGKKKIKLAIIGSNHRSDIIYDELRAYVDTNSEIIVAIDENEKNQMIIHTLIVDCLSNLYQAISPLGIFWKVFQSKKKTMCLY